MGAGATIDSSTVIAAAGWIYGITLAVYLGGMAFSGWRLRRVRNERTGHELAALGALIVGWPTGLQVQSELRSGLRDVASLVSPRTRPTLLVFAAAAVPFFALTIVLSSANTEWSSFATLPFAAIAVSAACLTWLRDGARRRA